MFKSYATNQATLNQTIGSLFIFFHLIFLRHGSNHLNLLLFFLGWINLGHQENTVSIDCNSMKPTMKAHNTIPRKSSPSPNTHTHTLFTLSIYSILIKVLLLSLYLQNRIEKIRMKGTKWWSGKEMNLVLLPQEMSILINIRHSKQLGHQMVAKVSRSNLHFLTSFPKLFNVLGMLQKLINFTVL